MCDGEEIKMLQLRSCTCNLFPTCYVPAFMFQEESVPYSFFINESEITGSLKETLETQTIETEKVVEIVYQPQAVFKVRAVTRCTSTIPGMLFIMLEKLLKPPRFLVIYGGYI